MVWGLLLGAAVMGFSLLVGSFAKLARALEGRPGRSREPASAD
jgi:hypothetical protein